MKKSKFLKRTLSVLSAAVVVASTVFSNGFVAKASVDEFKEVFESDSEKGKQISAVFNPSDFEMDYTSSLGVPGYFHIFAAGTYTQSTHVHGNFAASIYDGNGIDSGLREHYYASNIDYAQKLTGNINITKERNFIVLGDDYTVQQNTDGTFSVKDDANNIFSTFNGRISYIAVEKDTEHSPYIDIAQEAGALLEKSVSIANATPSKFLLVEDMNNGGILLDSVDADGNYVINLKYEDIANMNQFYIRTADLTNIDTVTDEVKAKFQGSLGVAGNQGEYPLFNFGDSSKNLIINLDMQGNEARTLTIRPYGWYNGPAIEYDENGIASDVIIDREMEFNENNILKKCSNLLWNFHSNKGPYTGAVTIQKEWLGSIMAPGAGLNMKSNAEGNYMCHDFTHTAETHIWVYTGDMPVNEIIPEDPTEEPTEDPTEEPTEDPTEEPTEDPTEEPT